MKANHMPTNPRALELARKIDEEYTCCGECGDPGIEFDDVAELIEATLAERDAEIERMRITLHGMVDQFAYRTDDGRIFDGGMLILCEALNLLGFCSGKDDGPKQDEFNAIIAHNNRKGLIG